MTSTKEALEAAAKALYETEPRRENAWYAPWDGDKHGILSEGAKEERRDFARAALEAALPHLREQIAQEIEAARSTNDYRNVVLERAAQIVRGEQ